MTDEEVLYRHYIANKSLCSYLATISELTPEFSISPYDFQLRGGTLDAQHLESMVDAPPLLIETFCREIAIPRLLASPAPVIGLSCIGQEQLFFTLLLGSLLKQLTDVSIVVGGTILSRIFERGSLPSKWFGTFFDIIVRNEGERPLEGILANCRAGTTLTNDVRGIVFGNAGTVTFTDPAPPLRPTELPVPDFDDLPLHNYLSAMVTLPILSSRGCYWGKCEFCHHGMVYGEKYEAYSIESVLHTIEILSQKYDAVHFAFNDEAIPPKLLRRFGAQFPSCQETGWSFTGLIKFEKIFERDDFDALARIGFRALYVGLESASERVLQLMRKNNRQSTMLNNLTDASAAGIWVHCFLFFGFPGETNVDAQQTYDFVLAHASTIGSIGVGTFSLEHNAPIFRHLDAFGVTLRPTTVHSVDVYYDYDTASGIGRGEALEWEERLNSAAASVPHFDAAGWIPREHLLCILSRLCRDNVIAHGVAINQCGGLPPNASFSDCASVLVNEAVDSCIVVNRCTRRILEMRGPEHSVMQTIRSANMLICSIEREHPAMFAQLRFKSRRSGTPCLTGP